MPAKGKKMPTVPYSASDLTNMARENRYIARLIEDAALRDNVRSAFDSGRSAYGRLSNGKPPSQALLEDKKLQRDLRNTAQALRDATTALTAPPPKSRGGGPFRMLLLLILGAGVALVASEKLRSKVLDTLFGAEEEFEYTPPPPPPSTGETPPTTPVSAA